MDSNEFYDDLADYYDLIFVDWEATMERQGAWIAGVLREALGSGAEHRPTILDVSAGIGTQSLPLARLGFEVTANDPSARAVGRLSHEASKRGVDIETRVGPMQEVDEPGAFDAVISFDNSIPHMLSDEELRLGLAAVHAAVRPGGVFVYSVRDYAKHPSGVDSVHRYGRRHRDGRVYDVRQEWVWVDDEHYETTMVVEDVTGPARKEVVRTTATYYALDLEHLRRLVLQAGFERCERFEGTFYQPVYVATRGDAPRR